MDDTFDMLEIYAFCTFIFNKNNSDSTSRNDRAQNVAEAKDAVGDVAELLLDAGQNVGSAGAALHGN